MKKVFLMFAACSFLLGIVAFAQAPNASSSHRTTTTGSWAVDRVPLGGVFPSIPNKMSYQGLLTTPAGAPATDGSYDLKFEIFSTGSGGSPIWSETQAGVSVQRGTFSVQLGSVTPLTAIFFQPLWVEVTAMAGPGVSVPVTFSPRSELISSAYSLGPLAPTGTGNYYLPSGALGIGAPPSYPFSPDINGFSAFVRAKSSSGYAGFWADKSDAGQNAYFVLRTAGLDEWSMGTQGNNDLTMFYWPSFSSYFKINTGDTVEVGNSSQTGAIHVFQSGSTSPVVRIAHHSSSVGGQVRVYDDSSNTAVQIEADFQGRGGYLGVYSDIGSTGFQVDGNYFGSLEPHVDIYGNSRTVGFHMDQTADASVQLPDSSISSAEILDEPGVANATNATVHSLSSTTMSDMETITITIPAPGYIVLEGKSITWLEGTTGQNELYMQIDETAGGGIVSPYWTKAGAGAYPGTGQTFFPTSCSRTYYKASAGSYTFRLEASQVSGNAVGATTNLYETQLLARYYPTAYGPVAASVPTIGGFTQYEPIERSTTAGDVTSEISYKVDLRELELKAMKTRLEAEKAERELTNARRQQGNRAPNDN